MPLTDEQIRLSCLQLALQALAGQTGNTGADILYAAQAFYGFVTEGRDPFTNVVVGDTMKVRGSQLGLYAATKRVAE